MPFKRLAHGFALLIFGVNSIAAPCAYSQNFPQPAHVRILPLTAPFHPAIIKGIRIHPEDPLKFDFIMDAGDRRVDANSPEFRQETTRLIKYFLVSLTVPETQMWVNLSPYEKDRISADGLGVTGMGRDMLAQDYLLKQMTSSLMYPESLSGLAFWKTVYAKALQMYGKTDIPATTFNKVWIVPDKAVVYERGNTVYVAEKHLKVMLEEDYLALYKNRKGVESAPHAMVAQVVRQIILPLLEHEINEGRNFSQLRQIYNSMILAVWYKANLEKSLLGQVYSDRNKTAGVEAKDKSFRRAIYERYVQLFKKGLYSYIREDRDPVTDRTIERKYFAGGVLGVDRAMLKVVTGDRPPRALMREHTGQIFLVDSVFKGVGPGNDFAMTSSAGASSDAFAGRLSAVASQWAARMSIQDIDNIFKGNGINPFWWGRDYKRSGLGALNGYRSGLENRLGKSTLVWHVVNGDYLNYLVYVIKKAGPENADAERMVGTLEEFRGSTEQKEFDGIVLTLESALKDRMKQLKALHQVTRRDYQAEVLITAGEQKVSLQNTHGDEYAVFNLQSLINDGQEPGMMFDRYERRAGANGEEYILSYVPQDAGRSKLVRQEVHVLFNETNMEYFVRLVAKPGETVSLGRVDFLNGSEGRFKDIFTPQPNLNNVHYFPADQDSILVSAKQTHSQHGDGSSWLFTPSSLAVGLRLNENSREWMMAGLAVQPGHYNFNALEYHGGQEKFDFSVNYGGHEHVGAAGWESPHLIMELANDPYQGLEHYYQRLVERNLVLPRKSLQASPAWWKRLMFCGWGAQQAKVSHLRPLNNPLDIAGTSDQSTERNYRQWLEQLEKAGLHPGTVVIDDKWQTHYDTQEVDRSKWPDLRGFVDEQHEAGRRVLLWMGLWHHEEQLKDAQGNIIPIDPTDPRFEAALRRQVRNLLSESGMNADGFKIDWTADIPGIEHRFMDPTIGGIEALHRYLEIIYTEAKKVKPDALIITQTANPYFLDVSDMLRLNDLRGDEPNVAAVMAHRARLAAAAGFSLIDSDDWPNFDLESWLKYATSKEDLLGGRRDVRVVPSIYFAGELPSFDPQNPVSLDWQLKRYAQFLRERGAYETQAPPVDAAMISQQAPPATIVIVSPEMTPFSQVGGLGDVAGQLSAVIGDIKRPQDQVITMSILGANQKRTEGYAWTDTHKEVNIEIAGITHSFSIWQAKKENTTHYFLTDHLGNAPSAQEAIFFARGVFEAMKVLRISPSIIHAQDWQGGLFPMYLKTFYQFDPAHNDPQGLFKNTKTILTIHNMGYADGIEVKDFNSLGIDRMHLGGIEWNGKLNFMKAGFYHADMLTTVAEEYAKEIQTPRFGNTLDPILREKAEDGKLIAIPNKIDTAAWQMKHLKPQAKKLLQQELGLPVDPQAPIMSIISRLNDHQKGMGMVLEKIRDILRASKDLQFVVMGTGDKGEGEIIEEQFRALAREEEFKGRVSVTIAFDQPTRVVVRKENMALSELIYEGSDFFLIPSRYEAAPMALLKALGKQTVPIGRSVGSVGSVEEYDEINGTGYGFKFFKENAQAMSAAIAKALRIYKTPHWANALTNLRKLDLSWTDSAEKYYNLYLNVAHVDKAAVARLTESSAPGGIDFNRSRLDLQVKRDGRAGAFPSSSNFPAGYSPDGFTPVIIRVRSMESLLSLDPA